MEISAYDNDRSPVLIACFVNGFAAGWRFAVPQSFREALDIQYTPVQVQKTTEYVWTQGKRFNFGVGSTLYDAREAYELPWPDPLKHVRLCVQVLEATSSDEVVSKTFETLETPLIETTPGRQSGKRYMDPDGLTVSKFKMAYGKLKFRILKPSGDLTRLEELETIACDQQRFVVFLQTGIIRTADHRTRDLFREHCA